MELAELGAVMAGLGQKPYRARQVFDALYKQRVGSVIDMTTLPIALREEMIAAGWEVGLPEMVQTATSVDGTERYLMRMADGETVETVWMPDGDGGERGDGSEAAAEEAGEVVEPAEAVAGWRHADSSLRNDKLRSRDKRQCGGAGGAGVSAGDDLYFEPGGVCGELPVLPDGEAGDSAEPDGRGNRRAGGRGAEPAWREDGQGPHQPGVHGDG